MTTQKQAIEALKSTAALLYVYSFNPDGKKARTETYGGLDCIEAFSEMSKRLAEGKLVVLTDESGWRELRKLEDYKLSDGQGRCTYEEAFPFSIAMFDDLHGNPIGNIKK